MTTSLPPGLLAIDTPARRALWSPAITGSTPEPEFIERLSPDDEGKLRKRSDQTAQALADRLVSVKPLHLSGSTPVPLADRGRFELACSALEGTEPLYTCLVPTSSSEWYLGLMARQADLPTNGTKSAIVMMRSLALARGYIQFCHSGTTELRCVIDPAADEVSVAFTIGTAVVDLAWLDRSEAGASAEVLDNRLAAELKTLVNFRLTRLRDRGVTVPLGRTVVTRESWLSDHLSRDVEMPRILREAVPAGGLSGDQLTPYLVVLGLSSLAKTG